VVSVYRAFSIVRFRNHWDDPVLFRGSWFNIGRDLSLYPAVRNGGFEADELEALLARVSSTDTVWDVGANIGIYSVLLGRAAADGHVIAFEPVPESRERLLGNLERNAVRNVTVEPLALSDRDGSARMQVHPDAHGCDHIELGTSAASSAGAIEVSTITGCSYAAASPFGAPDLVKVDIEGHEPEFLNGAWEVISRQRPTMMLEVNPTAWETPERYRTWSEMLSRLFSLYGAGDWYDSAGAVRVTEVNVNELGPHAYTLILPAS